jgi:predicted ester cyclase
MYKLKFVMGLIGVIFLGACQSQNSPEARNKALVTRYVNEILNGEDLSTADEIIASDYTFYRNGIEMPQRGADVFRAEEEEIEQYSDMFLTDEQMIAEGDTVAVRWHQTATYKPGKHPSKKEITWHGMSFYKIQNGLMAEGRIIDVEDTTTDQTVKTTDLESRNKTLVRRYVDEFLNKRNYTRAYEIITPDFTLYDNGQEAPHKGIDLFKSEDEAEDSDSLSELVLTIEEMVVEGNTVVIRWCDTALYTPSGPKDDTLRPKPLKWYGMSLYRIENGRIVEGHVMNDMNTIQKQIAEY